MPLDKATLLRALLDLPEREAAAIVREWATRTANLIDLSTAHLLGEEEE